MIGLAGNLRIVITGPTSDNGSMTALTREPSGRRASTLGLDGIDAPTQGGDDPVDDPQHVLVVQEVVVDARDLPAPFDVEVARAVDHDLRDRLVLQERIERPESADLTDHLVDQAHSFVTRHDERSFADDTVDDRLDPALELGRIGEVEQRVEGAHDLVLEQDPDLEQQLRTRGHACRARRERRRHGDRLAGGRVVDQPLRPLDPLQQ